jgi:MGT family glycosyltransferase
VGTAFMFNVPYVGHINPCIPLVRELVSRGERVVFYSTERFRAIAEAAGATFRLFPYEETDPGRSLTLMVRWQLRVTEASLPQLQADVLQYQPTYVICDYACVWGQHFARYMKLPLVCVFTTFPGAFDHRPGLRAMLGEVWRSPRLLGAALSFVMLDRRIARRLCVPRLETPMAIVKRCRGDLNIVMTSANIHASPAHPASDYHYVGPCVRSVGMSDGSPLPARDSRPLVYISLGTCFYRRPEFYRACVEAFSDGAYQVVLAAGASFADCCFERLPTHIHVRDRVDQIAALERAAVFVTHGGMNSVSESLFAGVPMVVFPQALDQFALARYVAANGSGMILQPEEVTAARIRQIIDSVAHSRRMRERARELGDEWRSLGGPKRAADVILAPLAETALPGCEAGASWLRLHPAGVGESA